MNNSGIGVEYIDMLKGDSVGLLLIFNGADYYAQIIQQIY
jgi:hypothetical protein